jgi:hypothetical protein
VVNHRGEVVQTGVDVVLVGARPDEAPEAGQPRSK